MREYISREWLLKEYDKRHEGPPGGARKLIEDAPSSNVVEAGGLNEEAVDLVRMCPEAVNLLAKKICAAMDNSIINGTEHYLGRSFFDPPGAQAIPDGMIEAARNGDVYL